MSYSTFPTIKHETEAVRRANASSGAVAIQQAIQSEREYQDAKWGAPADRPHEVGAWLLLMQVHLTKAQQAWAGANNDLDALNELRKVLAIGVACAEQHGLPRRAEFPAESMRTGQHIPNPDHGAPRPSGYDPKG